MIKEVMCVIPLLNSNKQIFLTLLFLYGINIFLIKYLKSTGGTKSFLGILQIFLLIFFWQIFPFKIYLEGNFFQKHL